MPRDLSEQLKIKTPCSANWDQMIGNEWVRFCEHCQLTVNELTPLTPKHVRRALVRSGADLNAQDKDGWTALDYAYSSDRERIIKQLLSYGAVTGRGKEKEALPVGSNLETNP
jgi:ankyrin repeat protein